MNNNKFEWNRFCKVVYKDLRNVWPTFGTTLLIITLLPMALWLLLLVFDFRDPTPIEPIFRLVMVGALPMLASIMTPSRLYRTLNLRGEGIYFAMLPASKLEKFLSILLYSIIVCPLMVLVAGVALDTFLWLLPFGSYRESIFSCDSALSLTLFDSEDIPSGALVMMFFATIFSHIASSMLFLFTSTIFRRHKVLQTFLWLWLIFFVLSLLMIPVMLNLFNSHSFMQWVEDITNRDFTSEQVANWYSFGSMVVNMALAVLFGWLSWSRIKKMPY